MVGNGSTDGTAEVAAGCGAHVVSEPQQGLGAACWRGLQESTADIVCFMDTDGSSDPGDLPMLVNVLEESGADLVLGGVRAPVVRP